MNYKLESEPFDMSLLTVIQSEPVNVSALIVKQSEPTVYLC